jgi:two-component system nitrogen regulation sensor histidine kinase GlnL
MQQDLDILDTVSTGIVAFDGDLRVTAINAAAQALLALSEARSMGMHAGELILRPEDWLQNLATTLQDRSPLARRGMPLALHNGQEIHVDLMVTPLAGKDAGDGVLVELQPVDRLLRISREEALMHAQETTRAVIRGLAHEIKNPLGGVRGAAQLLARELPNEELKEYTQVIIREADRLRDLVDRLLGPNQQLNLQPVNVHEILEHVRNLILAETDNSAHIDRDYDPSLPEIPADRSQMVQALLNIMRNALQAAESAQACNICLRTRSRRQFTIGSVRHRLVLQLDIEDNGPGVPLDLQDSIFVPMVTGRAEGTGLGLSISQAVVGRHGGLLECDSQPGKTRFTIYIPMEADKNA